MKFIIQISAASILALLTLLRQGSRMGVGIGEWEGGRIGRIGRVGE
jgi:hypothetical protein